MMFMLVCLSLSLTDSLIENTRLEVRAGRASVDRLLYNLHAGSGSASLERGETVVPDHANVNLNVFSTTCISVSPSWCLFSSSYKYVHRTCSKQAVNVQWCLLLETMSWSDARAIYVRLQLPYTSSVIDRHTTYSIQIAYGVYAAVESKDDVISHSSGTPKHAGFFYKYCYILSLWYQVNSVLHYL